MTHYIKGQSQVIRPRVDGAAFSGARYDADGSQTTAHSSDTQVVFDHPASYDTDGYTATADQFTIPVGKDGLFQLAAHVNLSAMIWDRDYIVYFDGSLTSTLSGGFIGGFKGPTNDGATVLVTVSPPPFPLSAGDYVRLFVRQNAGSTETILIASFSLTRVAGIPPGTP